MGFLILFTSCSPPQIPPLGSRSRPGTAWRHVLSWGYKSPVLFCGSGASTVDCCAARSSRSQRTARLSGVTLSCTASCSQTCCRWFSQLIRCRALASGTHLSIYLDRTGCGNPIPRLSTSRLLEQQGSSPPLFSSTRQGQLDRIFDFSTAEGSFCIFTRRPGPLGRAVTAMCRPNSPKQPCVARASWLVRPGRRVRLVNPRSSGPIRQAGVAHEGAGPEAPTSETSPSNNV